MTTAPALPTSLADIREEFLAVGTRDRLLLLLDYAGQLPPLPAHLAGRTDLLERVTECQAPVFVSADIEDGVVKVIAQAPEEAPTTRGFASVLVHGLSGLTVEQVLEVPDDYPQMLGLNEAVSPLRVRGMGGLLARIKRQLRARSAV
ncbi:MAG TPA: SufE family protein [Amnibacterium sp.]